MRTLVRQQSTAALAAVCLAVPAVITATQAPAPKIDMQGASHLAPVRTDNVALAAVSLLDALGLPLEAALWITTANPGGLTNPKYLAQSSIPAPPLPGALTSDPTGTYTSLYTVINNAIKILSVPATDLTTGQFGKVIADAQAAITSFVTSATTGLPSSVLATLEYVSSQLGGALGVSSASVSTESVDTVSTFAAPAAATPSLTGLDALGLPLEATLWITTANPGGLTNANYLAQSSIPAPPLPGALTSDPTGTYTSLYTVINNGIKIISAPATDLTTGQFDKIVADTEAAITKFTTSLTGFPESVAATVGYVSDQLGTSTTGFTTLNADTNTPDTLSAQSNDTPDPGSNVKTTPTTPKLKKGSATSGGFLNQLQGAVDNQLGSDSGVKVATRSVATRSVATRSAADPGSNPFSGKHGLGAFGQNSAKSGFGFAKKDHKKDSSGTD